MITTVQCSICSQLNNKHRVMVTDFRVHHTCSIIILWLHSLSGVIRSLLCNPHAFSPAIITRTWNTWSRTESACPAIITRTWNTWSRTESACVESTTRHYNRGARGRTYTPADHRRMRLRGNVYRSSITDVKWRYTKHCNVNKMADSSGLGPGKFIMLLTL